ncbi:hypothetical protein JTB14_007589 [Gonioctena quinquepunctata]|nr:hypothetical protein JTB14_007589 [Gonioctena quinquepunctata]
MKKEVFPHTFIDERKPEKQTPSQLPILSRKRKFETLQHMRDGVKRIVCSDEPSTSHGIPSMSQRSPMMAELVHMEVKSPSGTFLSKSVQGSDGVNVTRAEYEISQKMLFESQNYSLNVSKPKKKYWNYNIITKN